MGGLGSRTNLAQPPYEEPGARLVGYSEAARFLSVKVGTLRAWVHGGVVPFYRVGPRLVRFDVRELGVWLKSKSGGPR